MSDAECRMYVDRAFIHRPWLTSRVPLVLGLAMLVAWPLLVLGVMEFVPGVHDVVPLPRSADGKAIFLVITTVLVAVAVPLLVRDLGIYLGLKDEVHRARCRKCRQSLLGVPIQTIGADPDPAKQFIRCPECGRKFVLMELGLTPRDLVPFEQRGVPSDFGKKRPDSTWRR